LNTANKITLFRVILIPLFLLVCYLDFPYHLPVALAIFILASLSDFLDGYIARHRNQVTDFGKFMDPIADKVLVLSAMSMFVSWGRMPAWILVVVIARELAVSALRMIAVDNGRVIAAGQARSRPPLPWYASASCSCSASSPWTGCATGSSWSPPPTPASSIL